MRCDTTQPGAAAATAQANPVSFLAGGGEMGALMRAKDWAKTPLGSRTAWPQSLRTVVRIMLTSRYPMWMGWGAGPDVLLQRRLSSDARGQARLGPRAIGPQGLGEIWTDIGRGSSMC